MIIKFTCEYNGKNFNGFQRQSGLRTVQSVLEDALSKYLGVSITITGSGRTDTGVHARGQVCSFNTENLPKSKAFNPYKIAAAVNAFLPADVAVRDFELKDSFHAQFDAKSKVYIYRCYVNQHRSPLRDGTHLQLYSVPNISAMQTATSTLTGEHDFKAFASIDKTAKKNDNYVRTIYDFNIGFQNDEIIFTIRGNGFLRNMVRIMVGTILDIGFDKLPLDCLDKALTEHNRKLVGKTAPAHGLTLDSVIY